MMSSVQPPDDLKSLTALAKSFSDRGMFDEAIDLFQLALRFDPDNLGLKLSLAQVRHQQRKQQGHRRDSDDTLRDAIREQMRRNAIDAAHFLGLAGLYEERGKPALAAECLAIAGHKDLASPWVHRLHGKLLLQEGAYEDAGEELRTAQRYNPFDRQIAELLSQAESGLGHHEKALESIIDALLLLPDGDTESRRRLSRQMKSLRTAADLPGDTFQKLYAERRDKLQMAFERLEMQRQVLLAEVARGGDDAPAKKDSQNGRIELAARLRDFSMWQRLDDEEIFHLTQAAHVERHRAKTKIFELGSTGADIYVLEEGRVTVRRPTSYGSYELGTLESGAVFGEVNFISRSERSADVIALEDCAFVRFDAADLEVLIQEQPQIGVQIYLSFWQGLAQKLRSANEQLRTFFADEQMPEELLAMRQQNPGIVGEIEVKSELTLKLLREQGISGAELTTLANFSQVKRFPAGSFIFHEGDEGAEMYVVLEGQVMISKFIPGGGEEALAILRRGDFFGEMALIDGEPRSADAKAFQGAVSLVAFNDESLKEVLAMDPRSALDFMTLLCRLICKRLREIDEKVTGWRIMSGARPADDLHPTEMLATSLDPDLRTA